MMAPYGPDSPARRPSPGRAEIAAAIPAGSRRILSPRIERLYLDALTVDPRLADIRADARRNIVECAKWLARRARWCDGTSWHTREARCAQARVSPSTWKRARRRLESWGYLGTVREGTTDRFARPWALYDPEAPGEAAVYVLCIPRKSQLAGPAPPALDVNGPPTRDSGSRRRNPARGQRWTEPKGPRSRADSLPAMARELRTGPGKGISDGWARHLLGPFLAAGWTGPDVRHAVDHDPAGRAYGYDVGTPDRPRVRHPVGWLRARLAAWLEPAADGDGAEPWKRRRAALPPSMARAVGRQRDHTERARISAWLAGLAARRADPGAEWAAAREQLRRRVPARPAMRESGESPATKETPCERPGAESRELSPST